MVNNEPFNKEYIKNKWRLDRFATETSGAEIIEAGMGFARCRMTIDSRHLNAMGNVMGGALFTLADFAFAVAANEDNIEWASVSSTINYLSSAHEGVIWATARQIKKGGRMCVFNIEITDNQDKCVATVVTTGMRIATPN